MKKHYHFIGIGGVGMSALARILLKKGEKITGSDLKETAVIKRLKNEGAEIFIGHSPKNIKKNPNAVIYSTSISKENLEYCYAKEKKISLIHRSELLAQIMKGSAPLLVTGTHGKTTSSSLLAHLLVEAGLDPSYAIGGYLRGENSNGRFGRGIYFAIEADESDGTFLNYPCFGAIITNIGCDHMSYWKNEEALLAAFKKFDSRVSSKPHLLWCYDDVRLTSVGIKGNSYGFDKGADLVIENFQQIKWKMRFDISFEKKHYRNLEIPLIGAHNVQNAAAVFGLCSKLDISEQMLRKGLSSFKGVSRRVEKKGVAAGIDIYDDYAHHPTEIFATLRALKSVENHRRLVVVFQPHRFDRVQYCLDDFAEAFEYADEVIITDIYGAGGKPILGITPSKILQRIKEDGFENICFVPKDELPIFLSQFLKSGDVLVTMGAGDITAVGPKVIDAILKK